MKGRRFNMAVASAIRTNPASAYGNKLVSPEEAVKAVKSGDVVHYGGFNGTVYDLDEALAKRIHELHDLKIINSIWPYAHRPAIMQADPKGDHVKWQSTQFSPVERQMNRDGICWYIPVQYREQLKYWRQDMKIDVSMLQVAPMDRNGFFNVGPQVSDALAVIERARTIIVEVNDKMPRVCGAYGDALHISDVDYVVQGANRPLPERVAGAPNAVQQKIAELIVPLIHDGSSLQLGIGGLPNSVGNLIAASDIKDLSVHSEMFVDAFLNLYKVGKITGNKNLDRGKMVWTFSMGSRELYDFIDQNPLHLVYPVEYVNEISTIAKLDHFVSINSCLEVDLFGQVNSESSGMQHIGGNGGQLDFVLGAYLSKGGQSFLCTPSTLRTKDGQMKSLIRGRFDAGAVVTVPRQATHYIVTEYGVANMKAKSTWQRAEALINIAHPDFRDELVREAEKMGVWKTSSRCSK
jgi:butyryl-CoA:acetate CoA-transferase